MRTVHAIAIIVLFSTPLLAQNNGSGTKDDSEPQYSAPSSADKMLESTASYSNQQLNYQAIHSTLEIAFCIAILVFGAFVIYLEIYVMLSLKRYWDDWAFKVLGLTMVIVCGMFLIFAGYNQNQIAPMMALLGTIAGYLLGKESGTTSQSPQQEQSANRAKGSDIAGKP